MTTVKTKVNKDCQMMQRLEKDLLQVTDRPQLYSHILPQAKPKSKIQHISDSSSFASKDRFKENSQNKDCYVGPGYYDIKKPRDSYHSKIDLFGLSSGRDGLRA